MKNVGIHVLDFNDNIIDFISQSDGALINAEMSMNVEEKSETFDFTIENTRAEKLRERNRIIAQDNNGTFREFIIIHVADNFDGTTEIECNASYLEDRKQQSQLNLVNLKHIQQRKHYLKHLLIQVGKYQMIQNMVVIEQRHGLLIQTHLI